MHIAPIPPTKNMADLPKRHKNLSSNLITFISVIYSSVNIVSIAVLSAAQPAVSCQIVRLAVPRSQRIIDVRYVSRRIHLNFFRQI